MSTADTAYEGWSIMELMGHRRLGGFVREVTIAGKGMLRIDIPADEASGAAAATQFYPPDALYALTPVTEDMARAVARKNRPQPVNRWELPALPPSANAREDDDDVVDAY